MSRASFWRRQPGATATEENLDRGGFDMGRVTLPYCPCCRRPTRIQTAIEAGADILLTGDKDFLESGLENPRIMTPAEFLNMD